MNKYLEKILVSVVIVFVAAFSMMLVSKAESFNFNKPSRNLFSIKQDKTLNFVQMTDVHLDLRGKNSGKRDLSSSVALLQDAVNQVNKMKDIDFVVFSGDEINIPSAKNLETFSKIASGLKCPWYVALGNHDVGVNSSFDKNEFYRVLQRYNKYQHNILPYYSFMPKQGYLVLVMDGVIDSKITAHGYFPKEELNWMEKELKANQNLKVIIVQHYPLVEPISSRTHYVLNKQEYLDILDKYSNVVAVITGHYHAGKVSQVNNVVHISTPALVQYPNAFRLISLKDKDSETVMSVELKRTNIKKYRIKPYDTDDARNKVFYIK